MDNCIRCIWSDKCSIKKSRGNCKEFLERVPVDPVQASTCVDLVISTVNWDQDAMWKSVEQLLSEIPVSQHAALNDAILHLVTMVDREPYQGAKQDECINCIRYDKCSEEDDLEEDCYAFKAKPIPVQSETCIELVTNMLTWDSEAMWESVQQLLSEIPNSMHETLSFALLNLHSMVFSERSGTRHPRMFPGNKVVRGSGAQRWVESTHIQRSSKQRWVQSTQGEK